MEYQPPFFKRGPSPLARFTFFALFSVALLFADARLRYLSQIREAVSVALYPIERVARAPADALTRIARFFVTQSALIDDNDSLRMQTLRLSAQSARADALDAENQQLRHMLGAADRGDLILKLAEIIYSRRDPFSRKIVMDKGSQQGVTPGHAVVDETGLVGQVTRVLPLVSEVTLITDKNQAVPVQNLRTGVRAVLFGVGRDDTLELRFMPVNADIQSGDALVTSGIDGVYPAGFPVAIVASIDRSASNAFARITCRPAAGVNKGSLLMLVQEKRELPEKPPDEEAPAKIAKPRKGS